MLAAKHPDEQRENVENTNYGGLPFQDATQPIRPTKVNY
jgi:hypothetical protein